MKRIALFLGVAAGCCAAPALGFDLDPNARATAVAAAAAAPAPTPTLTQNLTGTHNPLPPLPNGVGLDARHLSSNCQSRSDLCFDAAERKLVYRPSRNWMPEIEGLTPEHMSLRRGVVSFKYSFK
jgi:hypothetical protein